MPEREVHEFSQEDIYRALDAARISVMPDEWLNARCKRCKRPRSEHAPFSLPSEWSVCENFMEESA